MEGDHEVPNDNALCLGIMINGPPGCGKDTAAARLMELFSAEGEDTLHYAFKDPLIDIVVRFYNVDRAIWDLWYTREGKEIPREQLGGRSCRGALIFVAQEVLKPEFGDDCIANLYIKKCAQHTPTVVVNSDLGFNIELQVCARVFTHIIVVRLSRTGTDYSDDSRGYVNVQSLNIQYIDIDNNDGLGAFIEKINAFYNMIQIMY